MKAIKNVALILNFTEFLLIRRVQNFIIGNHPFPPCSNSVGIDVIRPPALLAAVIGSVEKELGIYWQLVETAVVDLQAEESVENKWEILCPAEHVEGLNDVSFQAEKIAG